MSEFNSFITDSALIDLPMVGASFTWSSGRASPSLSRIDRCLICTQFESIFHNCRLTALERVESDHNPLQLLWGEEERVHRPWKFENMWLLAESFNEHMVDWWNFRPAGSGDLFLVGQKLKQLKSLIKTWNKEEFGRVDKKINEILEQIKVIDCKEEEGSISDEERLERSNLANYLDHVLFLEEISWRQKSGEIWLKIGDKNTGYFHRVANYNRRRNIVTSIRVNGVATEGIDDLKNVVVGHFSSGYYEEQQRRPFPDHYGNYEISDEDVQMLTRPFSEEEVWKIIRRCKGDKSPGPYGFSLAFSKSQWDVIRDDVMKGFLDFFCNGRVPKSIAH